MRSYFVIRDVNTGENLFYADTHDEALNLIEEQGISEVYVIEVYTT